MLSKSDLQQITKAFKTENEVLRNELKSEMRKGFDKLDKKLEYAINFLDRDYIKLLKRIDRIEKHLGLEPLFP
ncbi:hypothetical protein A2961_00755 [Candidatus Woesebacteria bacterium RIFCSPLOWO2_01_FULL_39_21]|uniref:Uncharacterized protein n=1 Tax=Candidatus Woesebacteria bacterium RIFCSPLOWO2_01_FULL_39_21 TaxID=1802519 RepID=A0A1F8BMN1_9BACT|nr:MAG: hypothetical protein A2691_02050 [Candidatus Woesebacteria bacterium RIFCSPHIGHO2_01_FULL_39_23]OGM65210.1 MAG: hypothetical protein A2961_00755 [Candidatus Woesebacteria bacterium RIFCSPLOWO2_01_FULL_39_21]